MSTTKTAPKFELVLAESGDSHLGIDRNFRKNRGDRLLANLLISAGLTGTWKFHYIQALPSTGHTPPITIKQHEQHGVRIRIKPGDNGSCVLGLLLVERASGLTPLTVHQKLMAAVEDVDKDLTDGLTAPVPTNGHGKPIPAERPVVAAGYTNGDTSMASPPRTETIVPPPGLPPSVQAAANLSILEPAITADTVLDHRAELERLARLPQKLSHIRESRKGLADQIAQLRLKDDQLAAQERELMGSFDLEALALLVDSMRKNTSPNEAEAR